MGLFKRKKDEEVKIQLEREALDKLNNNNVDLFEIPNAPEATTNSISQNWQISGKVKAPHTITAEELNGNIKKSNNVSVQDNIAEEIQMSNGKTENSNEESPSNFLYQKMMQSRVKLSENSIEAAKSEETKTEQLEVEIEEITEEKSNDNPKEISENATQEIIEEIPALKTAEPLDINAAIDDLKNLVNSNKTKENTAEQETNNVKSTADEDAAFEDTALFESQKADTAKNEPIIKEPTNITDEIHSSKTADPSPTNNIENMGSNAEERRATLLARCNAFLEDDSGPIKANVEKYKLESVESILKGFETRAAERATKKFNTDQSIFVAPTENINSQSYTPSITNFTNDLENTIVFEKANQKDENSANTSNKENALKIDSVKHIFTADVTSNTTPVEFEDISSTRIIKNVNEKSETISPKNILEKTSVFPVVESVGNSFDSTESTIETSDTDHIEDEKIAIEDYTGIADRQKILGDLVHSKNLFVLKTLLSLFALIISLIVTISPIAKSLGTTAINVMDFSVCVFVALTNFNVISGIFSLFGKKVKTSLPAALSLFSTTIFSLLNLILKENFAGFSAVAALTLFSYNFANKRFYSKTIKNFKLIADEKIKNAVSIIQNKGATKTIVGKSIDGSALICYGGETTNLHNFLKYTYCKNPISDKIQKLSIVSVLIGILLAIAAAIFNSTNIISSLNVLTSAICFAAIPAVFHIVSLTINSANKRLNHYDAMITGYRAADELELCNGIAISSDSLFPDGTIRLVDMKLLSPNPFDQTMLDAAAIAKNIHSPLAGIFEQIDSSKMSNLSAQEVDSVIYEEKMGISGWVNDRRVFVGNRDLLIAHGFNGLPPAELDKKIMRKGYFPVYIASDNILCALLIVRYEPDENIVYEIQRLANTGTTILVDNCDPNINEKMLADYFGVYGDTIFVMSKQGSDYYKALSSKKDHRSAGAAYKSRVEGLLASLTAAINIKKYISRMSIFYVICVIAGLLGISACIFTSLTSLITPTNILLIHLVITSFTLLPVILRKP